LVISLFILPALAVILKIRKRKLANVTVSGAEQALVVFDVKALTFSASIINTSTTFESIYAKGLDESFQIIDSVSKQKLSSILGKRFCFNKFSFDTLIQMQIGVLIFD